MKMNKLKLLRNIAIVIIPVMAILIPSYISITEYDKNRGDTLATKRTEFMEKVVVHLDWRNKIITKVDKIKKSCIAGFDGGVPAMLKLRLKRFDESVNHFLLNGDKLFSEIENKTKKELNYEEYEILIMKLSIQAKMYGLFDEEFKGDVCA